MNFDLAYCCKSGLFTVCLSFERKCLFFLRIVKVGDFVLSKSLGYYESSKLKRLAFP